MAAVPTKKVRIRNVRNGGENGMFCANAESMGWMRDDGERSVVHAAASVRRAEWFQGQLRVLCQLEEEEGAGEEVVALEGFANEQFDTIWRYFEESCGVHVKKHRAVAALDAEDFDRAMRGIEDAADRVDEAQRTSPLKQSRELDMLKKVESTRDGLEEAVSGDKQALNAVFSANGCERIGRLRLVLDTVQLEVYADDPRWVHLRNACATIEAVLRDLGTFRQWRPPEDKEHASMLRRMMVRELKKAQGRSTDANEEEAAAAPAHSAQDEPVQSTQRGGIDASAAAANFAPYGAPHPVYGVVEETEPPVPPREAPAPAAASAEPAAAPLPPPAAEEDAASEGGEAMEDEEVDDPNRVRASAPDDAKEGKARKQKTHPNSFLEGWVWKRSRFLRRWRRRWLVLVPGQLMSFKSRGSTKPTEVILQGTVVRVYSADTDILQARSFGVALSKRTYFMVCDTDAEKQAWIRECKNALMG